MVNYDVLKESSESMFHTRRHSVHLLRAGWKYPRTEWTFQRIGLFFRSLYVIINPFGHILESEIVRTLSPMQKWCKSSSENSSEHSNKSAPKELISRLVNKSSLELFTCSRSILILYLLLWHKTIEHFISVVATEFPSKFKNVLYYLMMEKIHSSFNN